MGLRAKVLRFFHRVSDKEFNEAIDELVAVGVVERRLSLKGEQLRLRDSFLASYTRAYNEMRSHHPKESEERTRELALVLALVRKAPDWMDERKVVLCRNIVASLLEK